MKNDTLPKKALLYKPKERRNVEGPRKKMV
jgi:hypothetical protein